MQTISLRFIRWGAGLLVIGLLTGYGPLFHYLSGGVSVSCPWAPVHGHVVLLGWVGFTLFGLVYRALPDWGNPGRNSMRMAIVHLWLSVVAVLGVYINGTFGYRLLDHFSPGFYYEPDAEKLDLWLSIDGWFLTLFAAGCLVFMIIIFTATRHSKNSASSNT